MFTSRRLSQRSQLSASWAQPPQHAAGDPKAGRGESAGPSQVPGGGRRREEFRGSEKGRLRRKTMRAFQKEKAKKKKRERRRRQRPRTQLPAEPVPRGRGGASPSGRVVASQTTGVPGVTPGAGEGVSKGTGLLLRGEGGRKRGICSSWEGGPREERGQSRNRLMLCRTPRVFLSGGITSTFRQGQELGGK